ncbi:hypothetical protein PSPO01_13762 [Paraphaeosphaeria sporulosa]
MHMSAAALASPWPARPSPSSGVLPAASASGRELLHARPHTGALCEAVESGGFSASSTNGVTRCSRDSHVQCRRTAHHGRQRQQLPPPHPTARLGAEHCALSTRRGFGTSPTPAQRALGCVDLSPRDPWPATAPRQTDTHTSTACDSHSRLRWLFAVFHLRCGLASGGFFGARLVCANSRDPATAQRRAA